MGAVPNFNGSVPEQFGSAVPVRFRDLPVNFQAAEEDFKVVWSLAPRFGVINIKG